MAACGALGCSILVSPEDFEKKNGGQRMGGQSKKVKKVTATLDKMARKKDTLVTKIALAHVML